MVNEITEIKMYDDVYRDYICKITIEDDCSCMLETNGPILLDYDEIHRIHDGLTKAYKTMFPEHFEEGGMYHNYKHEKE